MNIVVLHNQATVKPFSVNAVEKLPPYYTDPHALAVLRYQHSPYTARRRVFERAIEMEATKLVIVMGGVGLLHRAHWNGKGPRTEARYMNEAQTHGLWNYIDRLLDRYGHVYVPPMAWMRPWKIRPKPSDHVTSINNPTLPMVAGYRVKALAELDDLSNVGVGEALTKRGYDSFTIQDYFFTTPGNLDRLDETGSAATWSKNYERAISRLA
jgi:hypothetical protein